MLREDTVEVGARLYEIDTEAEASVQPSELVEASGFEPAAGTRNDDAATTAAADPLSGVVVTSGPSSAQHRVPSIHFLQKEGWAKRKAGVEPEAPEPAAVVSQVVLPPKSASPLAVTSYTVEGALPPMYGRPKFTAAEMDAIMYGGANLLDS
jgi:hypothetical protein